MITDTTYQHLHEAGRQAFLEGRPKLPGIDPVVRACLAALPADDQIAREVKEIWTAAFNEARSDAMEVTL